MIGSILDQIWNLPWYKVLVIAAADDVILFLKLWPVYIFIGAIIALWFIGSWWKYR